MSDDTLNAGEHSNPARWGQDRAVTNYNGSGQESGGTREAVSSLDIGDDSETADPNAALPGWLRSDENGCHPGPGP